MLKYFVPILFLLSCSGAKKEARLSDDELKLIRYDYMMIERIQQVAQKEAQPFIDEKERRKSLACKKFNLDPNTCLLDLNTGQLINSKDQKKGK